MKQLCYRIRQARKHARLSQAALAAKIGVNRSAVAQWERLGGSRPTTENMGRVAIATAASYEWLATGRGPMVIEQNEGEQASALLLKYYAHDEIEERLLIALRKLDYSRAIAVAQLAESLAQAEEQSRRVHERR